MTENPHIQSDVVQSGDIEPRAGQRGDVLGEILSALRPDHDPERVTRDISAALSDLIPHDHIQLCLGISLRGDPERLRTFR